jgi:uncharacterized protein YpmB
VWYHLLRLIRNKGQMDAAGINSDDVAQILVIFILVLGALLLLVRKARTSVEKTQEQQTAAVQKEKKVKAT